VRDCPYAIPALSTEVFPLDFSTSSTYPVPFSCSIAIVLFFRYVIAPYDTKEDAKDELPMEKDPVCHVFGDLF